MKRLLTVATVVLTGCVDETSYRPIRPELTMDQRAQARAICAAFADRAIRSGGGTQITINQSITFGEQRPDFSGAGRAIGRGIRTAVERGNAFDACMAHFGWVK